VMQRQTLARKLVLLCMLLVALPASAADYKQWIPLLPLTLDGLPQSGQTDGVNMEMGPNSWSSLEQEYSKQSRTIKLMIVSGTAAPQTQMFQGLTKLEMETADELIRTIKIKGYQSVLSLNKKRNQGSVMVGVKPHTLVIIEANQIDDQAELTSLANQVPLARIASGVD
jgi:hypothetical protein